MSLVMQDRSSRERTGCKGPAAEAWLASHGIAVPAGANRYAVSPSGLLVARLATSEFLLEAVDGASAALVEQIRQAHERFAVPAGVYPVLRQDCMLEIYGLRAPDLFLQSCALNLEPIVYASLPDSGPVAMTSMIGVSVVLICRQQPDGTHFLLWSDPSYGTYFRKQLSGIAAEPGVEVLTAPSRSRGNAQ